MYFGWYFSLFGEPKYWRHCWMNQFNKSLTVVAGNNLGVGLILCNEIKHFLVLLQIWRCVYQATKLLFVKHVVSPLFLRSLVWAWINQNEIQRPPQSSFFLLEQVKCFSRNRDGVNFLLLRSALRMTHKCGEREKISVAKVSGQQPERILHGTEFLSAEERLTVK